MKLRVIQVASVCLFSGAWGAGIAATVGWSSSLWLPNNEVTHERFGSVYWRYTAPLVPLFCAIAGGGGFASYLLLKWALQLISDMEREQSPLPPMPAPLYDDGLDSEFDPEAILFSNREPSRERLEAQFQQTPPVRDTRIQDPLEMME